MKEGSVAKAKKLKLKKKLKKALTLLSLSDIQENIGSSLNIRRWPSSSRYIAWLAYTRVKKTGAKHFSGNAGSCSGEGDTPGKALKDLLKQLQGKTLRPDDGGPCRDGHNEMVILGKVLPH